MVKSIVSLHKDGVVHRNLLMSSFQMRESSSLTFKVHKVQAFDLAICTKPAQSLSSGVLKTLNLPLAPEILSGDQHDSKVDVWSLGQLAYQLLICPHQNNLCMLNEDDAQIQWPTELNESGRRLILAMIARDPKQRPSLSTVLQHPWLRSST